MSKGEEHFCWVWMTKQANDILEDKGFLYLTVKLYKMDDGTIAAGSNADNVVDGEPMLTFIKLAQLEKIKNGFKIFCRVKLSKLSNEFYMKILCNIAI